MQSYELQESLKSRYPSIHFDHPITWESVFDIWRNNEASQEEWRRHWEAWGFAGWEEWRKHYAAPLDPEHLQWAMYTVGNPCVDVLEMLGVPSVGWIANVYRDTQTLPIREIVNKQGDGFDAGKNDKICAIRDDFPQETTLTGIVWKDRIVLIEGMHRACALGMGQLSKEPLVHVALAEWKNASLPLLGGKPMQ